MGTTARTSWWRSHGRTTSATSTRRRSAAVHGLSRSQVSRYLQAARDEGIVQIRIVPPRDRVPDLEAALRSAFPHLREVVVARVFNHEPLFVRRAVASASARVFDRLIRPGQTVCVGAGRTMALAAGAWPLADWPAWSSCLPPGMPATRRWTVTTAPSPESLADTLGGIAYRINAPAIVGASASAADLARCEPADRRGAGHRPPCGPLPARARLTGWRRDLRAHRPHLGCRAGGGPRGRCGRGPLRQLLRRFRQAGPGPVRGPGRGHQPGRPVPRIPGGRLFGG